MVLSDRLKALKAYFHDVPEVWDIGCDHGLLGSSFSDSPSIKKINLVDSSKAVIETLANAHIPIRYLINIIHQDGKNLKFPNSIPKCIFIAGMGGKEIEGILKNFSSQVTEKDRLIISPHRKILELRQYLHASNFTLIDEQILFENEQFYLILCLSTQAQYPKISLYGDKLWHSPIGKLYLKHQIATFSRHNDPQSMEYLAYLNSLNT